MILLETLMKLVALVAFVCFVIFTVVRAIDGKPSFSTRFYRIAKNRLNQYQVQRLVLGAFCLPYWLEERTFVTAEEASKLYEELAGFKKIPLHAQSAVSTAKRERLRKQAERRAGESCSNCSGYGSIKEGFGVVGDCPDCEGTGTQEW